MRNKFYSILTFHVLLGDSSYKWHWRDLLNNFSIFGAFWYSWLSEITFQHLFHPTQLGFLLYPSQTFHKFLLESFNQVKIQAFQTQYVKARVDEKKKKKHKKRLRNKNGHFPRSKSALLQDTRNHCQNCCIYRDHRSIKV